MKEYNEFEVESIAGIKKEGSGFKFLVRWKGYSESDNTWEPFDNVTNSRQLLKQFFE